MAGLLKSKFREAAEKKGLGSSNLFTPYYRTGIDIFDYINGVVTSDGRLQLGIQGGKITQDIGNSGTGKTSKVIGQACFIADQFEESTIIHYDFERSSSKERVLAISGWTNEHYEEKYELINKDISVETLFKACKELEKIKLENKNELLVDSGARDGKGNPIMVLPPTIIIVDSVALLAPEDTESDDELKGSMGKLVIAWMPLHTVMCVE